MRPRETGSKRFFITVVTLPILCLSHLIHPVGAAEAVRSEAREG